MSLRPRPGACLALLSCSSWPRAGNVGIPEPIEASASSSASPSAAAAASESAKAGGPPALRMGELPAGQYTTNAFEPNLVLTLPEGWSQFFPDEDDEIALGGPGVELNITRPPEVVDPVDARAGGHT